MPVWVARGLCIQHHGPTANRTCRCSKRWTGWRDGRMRPRLVRLLRHVAPTWLAQMPWLSADDDAAPAVRQPLQVAGPERMLREFAAFVEALTADGTLVLVLEDLHWSDPSTVDLLSRPRPAQRAGALARDRHLPARRGRRPRARLVAGACGRCGCTGSAWRCPCPSSSAEDVRAILELRFPGADFSVDLARVIHEHTDGNPLFVVAVVDHMLSRGWILDTAPGWALSTAAGDARPGRARRRAAS